MLQNTDENNMKHPWVNILILVFVTVEFVSGFFGLVSGMRDEAVFIIIHRIAGYGLVVLPGLEGCRHPVRPPQQEARQDGAHRIAGVCSAC